MGSFGFFPWNEISRKKATSAFVLLYELRMLQVQSQTVSYKSLKRVVETEDSEVCESKVK